MLIFIPPDESGGNSIEE